MVGLYYLDGRSASRLELSRMTGVLAHRGQAETMTLYGSIGLAQIEPGQATLAAADRPASLAHQAEALCIAADARLDNREELLAGLGLQAPDLSDAVIILRAYERWETECPKHLLGDFAFAIWDGRRRSLFCARDHIGIKPFYYFASSRLFACASEIKSLLCLNEVPRRLNEVRVADYLLPLFADTESTFFEGLFRLPPGHSAMVGRGGLCLERYWSLERPGTLLRLNSDEDYAEAYRHLLTEAVRCRIDHSVPAGSLLSGGLDSSSITCLARSICEERGEGSFQTYSAIFPEVPQCDERPFIQAVHKQGGCDPHFVRADWIGPLASIDAVMRRQDEPFWAPNLFIHQALYRSASEHGVRVLLDGIDGDTTVSHGLVSMAEQARAGEWRRLLSNVRGLARNLGQSELQIARRYVLSPLAPQRLRQGWRWIRRCGDQAVSLNPTLQSRFSSRLNLAERCAALDPGWAHPPSTEQHHHYRRLTRGILPFALEILDRAGTMYGVEARYPFCDKRLIEFCYAVPPEQKLHDGWTRMIARRAMKGILPDKIRWRGGKSNLSANFNRGLLQFEKPTMDRVILKDPSAIAGYVDVDALRQIYARFQATQAHGDAMTIWKALTLGLWLEQSFFGSRSGGT